MRFPHHMGMKTHGDRSDRSPGYGPLRRGPATGASRRLPLTLEHHDTSNLEYLDLQGIFRSRPPKCRRPVPLGTGPLS